MVFMCFLANSLAAQDRTTPDTIAVGNRNEAYVTAFNKQDLTKLSDCFSDNADFTLLTGDTVAGQKNVVRAHAAFFKNNPGARINGKQITYRLIQKGVVLASGKWNVTDGPSAYPASGTWYTVVVNREGKWQYEAMRLMAPPKPAD